MKKIKKLSLLFFVCANFSYSSYGMCYNTDNTKLAETVSAHFEQVIAERFGNAQHVQNLEKELQDRYQILRKETFTLSKGANPSMIRYRFLIALLKAIEDYRMSKTTANKEILELISRNCDETACHAINVFIGNEQPDIVEDEDW